MTLDSSWKDRLLATHDHEADSRSHAGHNHGANASASRLAMALGLTTAFLIVEGIGAWWFNSLALLSDAGHMFTDTAALAIALAAVKIGQRPADDRRTYGYRRFEVLAATFNAVLLFVVAGYVLVEGVRRFLEPTEVQSLGMLIVAGAGLVINLIAMRLLAGGKEDSLNVKGAYLEVWADMLGSIGVIIGALVIMTTGWQWVDPLVAIAIGLWVLPRTWVLLRDTTHILLQGVPRGFDLKAIRAAIAETAGVNGVHDLHLWSVAGDDASLTAHVAIGEAEDAEIVRRAVAEMLEARFAIHHVTLQTESVPCDDETALHR
jgi:cobalt-zinc-cadmium efflux system protein